MNSYSDAEAQLITDLFIKNVRASFSGSVHCVHGVKDVTKCPICKGYVSTRLKAIERINREHDRILQLVQSEGFHLDPIPTAGKESQRSDSQ